MKLIYMRNYALNVAVSYKVSTTKTNLLTIQFRARETLPIGNKSNSYLAKYVRHDKNSHVFKRPYITGRRFFMFQLFNPEFENYLSQMYPVELEIKDTTESNTSASYLDLLLSIGRDGQLHTSIYDKRDDFNFHFTNFPFLSSNIPTSPAYGVFISQLIRYARAYSSYRCFILRATRLSNKLLEQGYVKERLKSSLRKFYGRYGDLIKQYEVSLSQMLNDIL